MDLVDHLDVNKKHYYINCDSVEFNKEFGHEVSMNHLKALHSNIHFMQIYSTIYDH